MAKTGAEGHWLETLLKGKEKTEQEIKTWQNAMEERIARIEKHLGLETEQQVTQPISRAR